MGKAVACAGVAMRTSVIFDSHVYSRVDMLRRKVYGLLAVDVDILVLGRIVRRTDRDPENVLFVLRSHYGLVG
jgi:hypothetical protein